MTQEQQTKTQRQIIEDHMPRVVEWLREIKINLDDVTSVGIGQETERDYEREEEENSKWKIWKPGDHMTVILMLKDQRQLKRTWHKDQWNAE